MSATAVFKAPELEKVQSRPFYTKARALCGFSYDRSLGLSHDSLERRNSHP